MSQPESELRALGAQAAQSAPFGAKPAAPWRPTPRQRGTAAFTLIEMIGVLAILAIMASIAAPVFIAKLDQAARTRDAAELNGLASALRSVILRTGYIPGTNDMPGVLAMEMGVATNQVLYNSRGVARAFLVDPNLWVGSPNTRLPYAQTNQPGGTSTTLGGLSSPGLNLRLLIISSLSSPIPASPDFNTAWSTPGRSVPADWPPSWGFGNNPGDDLQIQRIDLTPLFHRVILNPLDPKYSGSFAVESSGVAGSTNLATAVFDTWLLESSVLCLYDTNPPALTTNLELKAVIQNDLSYVFENQAWRSLATGWGTSVPGTSGLPYSSTPGDVFTALANSVAKSPGGVNGSTLSMLSGFYSLMGDYNFGASVGFAVTNGPLAASIWNALSNDAAAVQTTVTNLSD